MPDYFRKTALSTALLAAVSGLAMDSKAQEADTRMATLEEIVVTARRRNESLQTVPVTVNAVTAAQIDDLNLRKLEDLQAVVAGLTLQEDSIAANASMRGVRFDTFASGNNSTVEFYLDDAPISSLSAMQALFDVAQVEVLRGPQGTLRGRASPSGSITITTQKPLLDVWGGYLDVTATDIGGKNARGALNLPLVEDRLALRVSGFWEQNRINDTDHILSGDTSRYKGHGYRLGLAFRPVDSLSIDAMYQRIEPERKLYFPVESAHRANPELDPGEFFIRGRDRRATQSVAERADQTSERFNLNASWDVAGQQLNYVFSDTEEKVSRGTPFQVDTVGAISANHPASEWYGAVEEMHSRQKSRSHEIRLQSSEPLFERLNYVVGFLHSKNTPTTHLLDPVPMAFFVPTGAPAPNDYFGPVGYALLPLPILSKNPTREESFFGNLAYALTDRTELSLGARQIAYKQQSDLLVDGEVIIGKGSPLGSGKRSYHTTIYSLSLKQEFTDDLMGYFSFGTSWRAGANAVGDFSVVRSPLQQDFVATPPEKSKSYEIGIRSSWLDQRLRLNASLYYQDFDNSPYRAGGDGVYYASYSPVRNAEGDIIGLAPEVTQHNFIAAVPIEVRGVELDGSFQVTDDWTVGALVSYAKGEIKSGLIPCNDYLPHDGRPDVGGVPALEDIIAAAGSDNLTACKVSMRANNAPLWTATLSSEYRFPVMGVEGYVRGLWTLYGSSKNDPTNAIDDVSSYNTLNLYLGVRAPDGTWEAMVYGKNLFDTTRVLQRNADPGSFGFTGLDVLALEPVSSLSGSILADYREVRLTAPRELGINIRYHF